MFQGETRPTLTLVGKTAAAALATVALAGCSSSAPHPAGVTYTTATQTMEAACATFDQFSHALAERAAPETLQHQAEAVSSLMLGASGQSQATPVQRLYLDSQALVARTFDPAWARTATTADPAVVRVARDCL